MKQLSDTMDGHLQLHTITTIIDDGLNERQYF
jgi:hypothetical protein